MKTGWFGNYFFAAATVHAVRDEDVRRRSPQLSPYGTTVCGRRFAHVEDKDFAAFTGKSKCKRCTTKEA